MKFKPPRLAILSEKRPELFLQTLERLGLNGIGHGIISLGHWNHAARRWIINAENGYFVEVLDIYLARAIAFNLVNVKNEKIQNKIIAILLSFEHPLAWQVKFFLWCTSQSKPSFFINNAIVKDRQYLVLNREMLPPWIANFLADDNILHDALDNAPEIIVRWVIENNIPLLDFLAMARLPITGWCAIQAIRQILLNSPHMYIKNFIPQPLIDFTNLLVPLLKICALDRLLCSLVIEAGAINQIYKINWRHSLWLWIHDSFSKDIVQNSVIWRQLSEKAKAVYDYLQVINEIDKIFNEFKKSPEDERAIFWSEYCPQIEDAYLYHSKDNIPICIFLIPPLFIIEFGVDGHACRIYEIQERSATIKKMIQSQEKMRIRKMSSIDFRSNPLRLGGHILNLKNRLVHRGDWEHQFRDYLIKNNIYR